MFSSKKSARHAPNPPNDASERQENEQPTASSETPRSMPKEQVYETGLKSARHEPRSVPQIVSFLAKSDSNLIGKPKQLCREADHRAKKEFGTIHSR